MVYHYTNFIAETNAWWLRRVRPVTSALMQLWMAGAAAGAYFIFHRYYFFGKRATQAQRATSPEVWQERAKHNKRNWGYNSVYKPTLERSRKKQIMEAMGSNWCVKAGDYDYPLEYSQRYQFMTGSLDELLEEENNW